MTVCAEELAINGGRPACTHTIPPRTLYGSRERDAILEFLDRQCESPMGYNGPIEQEFEAAFADWMGGGWADGVSSGTAAVYVALAAFQLEPGDEVVIPPVTDPGGAMPVAVLNLIPVQCDSAPDSFNMGAEQLEAVITPKTKAVIVAHIAGIPADMPAIIEVAHRHGLKVIEDCAQAHGTRLNGRLVGTFGDIATFSTMFSKHIATGGQGGVVFTKDEALAKRVKRCADRGKPFDLDAETNVFPSLNFNLSDLAAAIGKVQLSRLPELVERRRRLVEQLRAGLRSHHVQLGCEPAGAESTYFFLHVKVDGIDKDRFAEALAAEGVSLSPRYRQIQSDFEWFRKNDESRTPYLYKGRVNTEPMVDNIRAAIKSHFVLYVHEDFQPENIQDIIDAIEKVECYLA